MQASVPRTIAVAISGLSSKRLIAAEGKETSDFKVVKGTRSGGVDDEAVTVVVEWVEATCRPSADKSNLAHDTAGNSHHVYYKTWSGQEGWALFRAQRPAWRFGKTSFNKILGSIKWWLKNAKHSLALCHQCANMALLISAARRYQARFGAADVFTENRFGLL